MPLARLGIFVLSLSIWLCPCAGFAATDAQMLAALVQAYPGLDSAQKSPGQYTLSTPDGQEFIFDDGVVRDFEQKLDSPDLKDMLEQIYPLGPGAPAPAKDFDPGRIRLTRFFAALYGKDKTEIKNNCVSVNFAGARVLFNARFGAAKALGQAGEEIAELLKTRPEFKRFVFPLGGSLSYREIAGTSRLSMHSFGIAIDLNPKAGGYWRWDQGPNKNAGAGFPPEIVEIFERHGFIWGGKWYHHDLMHFEYRPEIIGLAKVATLLAPRS